jgi:hypothetical protein
MMKLKQAIDISALTYRSTEEELRLSELLGETQELNLQVKAAMAADSSNRPPPELALLEQKADAHERPLWEQDIGYNIEEPQDLLEDSYEPPGTGPDDSYYFATDGSIDEAAGKGGYSSVTPHSVDGWEVNSSGACSARGQGVSCYGAEPVAIDTCELMAVVDILENGPRHHLTLLVDVSYIMFGFHSHLSGLRRQLIEPSG